MTPELDTLRQLTHVTWDGDLISKSARDSLVKNELAVKACGGWNLITPKGVEYLSVLGLLKRLDAFLRP